MILVKLTQTNLKIDPAISRILLQRGHKNSVVTNAKHVGALR